MTKIEVFVGKKDYEENLKKAKQQQFNINAIMSEESLQEMVRIGAINKEYVDQGLIKVGDFYRKYFTFEDIFILAKMHNLITVIEEITSIKKKTR